MAHTSVQEYAQALHLALQESGPEDADMVVANLASVLKENGDLGLYEEVINEFEQLVGREKDITQVDAVFARESTENSGVLKDLNSIIGPNLEVRSKVDNELVGGMVLRVDDTLIDASLKGGLDSLQKHLTE
jgi:F-type H+-transporting ATPase subunit delta